MRAGCAGVVSEFHGEEEPAGSKDQGGRMPPWAHLDTSTTAAEQRNRNGGLVRQAGEWDLGCRMNPAFRWWFQDAPEFSLQAS